MNDWNIQMQESWVMKAWWMYNTGRLSSVEFRPEYDRFFCVKLTKVAIDNEDKHGRLED